MAGVMVSASTGAMNAVIGKLTSLVAAEYELARGVKKGIRFLRDELSSMNAVLLRLADMEMEEHQIDPQAMEWRSKVRELSYDIEDCIDRFMLRASSGEDMSKANFLRKAKKKMKAIWDDRKIAKEIQELKALVEAEDERRQRYNIDQRIPFTQYVPIDPRATEIYEEAKNLVGVDGPREEIIQWLNGGKEQPQPHVVSIFGGGGLGKTALAREVYNKIEQSFDHRAFVSVSRKPEINKLLRDILFQINRSEFDRSEKWDMAQLIPTLRHYLKDKRYMIIVDDIWDVAAWEAVKSALPNNKNRSIIITTTRIKDVAKSCCSDLDGLEYELRPLGEDDSRKLFLGRIFPSNEDCPPELRKVVEGILKKCGGLPLAIISISSLLASKDQNEETWMKIRSDISSGVEKDSPVAEMGRILLLSFLDLPLHLRTCLLYLSVFPEDHIIDSKLLIWSWVAEGLVLGQNRQDMEQAGKSYLNELINRSMIQVHSVDELRDTISCKVHDVIHDMIIGWASKENFVTIVGNSSNENYSNNVRRLSLQKRLCEAVELPKATMNASHLRSLHCFGSITLPNKMPGKSVDQLSNCQALRVLDIEGNWKLENCHIAQIGSFSQLRYLRLMQTSVTEIPEQIGKLHNLQTLDVRESYAAMKLPESIVQLRKLVRLFIDSRTSLPDGIENMQALEELSEIGLGDHGASVKCIQGLGELTKLRVLKISFPDPIFSAEPDGKVNPILLNKVLGYVQSSICKLLACSLVSLEISHCLTESWIVPCDVQPPITPPLQKLNLKNCYFDTIPSQIGSLANLTHLCISLVEKVDEEGFRILAGLPKLLHLFVNTVYSTLSHFEIQEYNGRHVICSQGFGCLRELWLQDFNGECLTFEPGAMPRLQNLNLEWHLRCQFKRGVLSLGLQHLLALKHITMDIPCGRATGEEVQALEDDVRGVAAGLPNRPALKIRRFI